MNAGPRVGARIKALRKRRRLKQADLAARIDRSVETVSALERGKALPGFTTLELLAQALDISVSAFFDGDEPIVAANRAGLLARLIDAATALPDPLLRVAVEQIEVLEQIKRLR